MPPIERVFQEAERLRAAGDYAAAEQHYREVLTLNQTHGGAILGWGIICLEQKRLTDALQLLELAARELPASAEAHLRYGNALQASQRWAEAIAHFQLALQLRPRWPSAHVALGDVLQAVGRPAEAVEHYQTALSAEPTSAEALNNLGSALLTLGQPAEAARHLEAALRASPQSPQAHNNLGNALLDLSRPEEAAASYGAALALDSTSIDIRINLGRALQAAGSLEEALAAFQAALALDPRHAGALFNTGNALQELHRQGEALIYYRAAIALQPNEARFHNNHGNALQALHRYDESLAEFMAALAINANHLEAHYNLANTLQSLNRWDEAQAHYEHALRLDPDNRVVHQGLAILLLLRGETAAAAPHGKIGFRAGLEPRPFRGSGQGTGVLVLESAIGGNVRTQEWIDDRRFASTVVTVEFLEPGASLPPHALVVNAISDADRCPDALKLTTKLLARAGAPVVNQPERVLATGRAVSAGLLGALDGVVTPRTVVYARRQLAGRNGPRRLERDGFCWPVLLRALGYHTGEYFEKVDSSGELEAALSRLPGDQVLAIEYLDLFGADGTVRKYRVMLIDGQLYPLHLAVSHQWKVHYFSADMAASPAYRAEDAAFLADMPAALGSSAVAALERIQQTVGLDYAGVDCGLDREGRVAVFEANASMVVPRPEPGDDRWTYRVEPVERIYTAIDAMLAKRAGLVLAGET